ncbi:MAG: metal ABC transporter permease [Patescibacteria group bacterium]
MSILDIFQYGFMVRGLAAGLIIGAIAPLIGAFLVLRRYSLIADTLSHVSLLGIAGGLLLGVNPLLGALAAAVLASLGIEKLRTSRRIYGESALALFLSGSLALAVIILSVGRGFNTNLLNYLFGSIVTVTAADVALMSILAVIVVAVLGFLYKELVYITFDEESAQVSGLPTKRINLILIILAAVTIALSIPIIGVLLIAAMIVIPVVAALQLRQSFGATILYAELFSLFSVVTGIVSAFYFDLSAGGMIVIIMLAIFLLTYTIKSRPAGGPKL